MVDKSAPKATLVTPGRPAPAPAMPGAGMLSKLGHELRSPLAGIIGLTRILLTKLGTEPADVARQRRQLEMVLTTARQALATIEQVVDIARIESGGVACDRHPVDGRGVAAEVTAALRPAAEQRGLTLRIDLPGRPVVITTDAGILARVLRELVGNAVKFADAGEVVVRIRADDDGSVVIEVTDDGPGIPAGDQTRIFAAFERGELAAQRDEDGSGLGLYQAGRLADLLAAELSVRSMTGGPTTFTVRFPAPGTDPGTQPRSRP